MAQALKAASKDLIVLSSDPLLRISRVPDELIAGIEQMTGLGAQCNFLSNWDEDILTKVKKWQDEEEAKEGGSSEEEVEGESE